MQRLYLLSKDAFEKFRAQYKDMMASGITAEQIKPRSEQSVSIQGRVAVIPVHGYISKYYDFFTMLCGGCSQEDIRREIECAVNDPEVSRIVLEIDSPGGDASGTAELAEFIRASSQRKQITAYVSGWACSAAYWLASACSHIIAHKSAFVGGIGTIVCFEKPDGSEIVFTSAATPNKNIDPVTEEGKAEIMGMLNNMTDIFVQALAEYRGVTVDEVLKNFGQGSAIFSENALQNRMIDSSGALETACEFVLSSQQQTAPPKKTAPQKALKGGRMKTKNSLVVVDDTAEGVVIPNGTKVDELTAEWLRENAPDVVSEIEGKAEEAEMGRQSELDETAANAETPEEAAMVKAAKTEKGMTATKLAAKILAHRSGVKKAAEDEKARLLASRQNDAGDLNGLQTGAPGEGDPAAITSEQRSQFVAQAMGRRIG